MEDEQKANIAIAVEAAADDARVGAWAAWEQSRTRHFLDASVTPIDDKGILGQVRNKALQLEVRRQGQGFVGNFRVSLEENVGPYRIRRGTPAGRLVDAQGNSLASFAATGLAASCGGWRQLTWEGPLAADLFDRVASFQIGGDIETRRC